MWVWVCMHEDVCIHKIYTKIMSPTHQIVREHVRGHKSQKSIIVDHREGLSGRVLKSGNSRFPERSRIHGRFCFSGRFPVLCESV